MPDYPKFPTRFAIATDKINSYLLSLSHETGAAKARFFIAHGFEVEKPDVLVSALFIHAGEERFVREVTTLWGVKLIFEGPLYSPDNRNPFVRTIWQRSGSVEEPFFLVSAYPP